MMMSAVAAALAATSAVVLAQTPLPGEVDFRPPLFALDNLGMAIVNGRETSPWSAGESWVRGYAPCEGELAVITESSQQADLEALGLPGLPIAAEVGDEEIHTAAGIVFEALNGGIVFTGDGGIALVEEPSGNCAPLSTVETTVEMTLAPTPTPSMAPTSTPSMAPATTSAAPLVSTAAPTPAPTPAPTCPRNCAPGSYPEQCSTVRSDGSVRCRECNPDRLLSSGYCYRELNCKGRRVFSGSRVGEDCTCLQRDDCHYCNRRIVDGVDTETCRVCRNGMYELDGTCYPSCPADHASSGISLFKRRCLLPHTCRSGRIIADWDVPNFGCKCPDANNVLNSNCFICEHRAGAFGQHCVACRNSKFLHQNECLDNCDGLPGLIHYSPGTYRRECRPPFTCTDRMDLATNTSCTCSREVGKNLCKVCDWDAQGSTCRRCTSGRYLYNGVCRDACPPGTTPIGDGPDGRECV